MVRFLLRCLGLVVLLAALALAGFRLASHLRESAQADALAPATGQFLDTAEGRVFYQELGPRDGTPLLFVHGTGAWSELWRETLETIAAQGYRAIAMDLTPFGFSERAADRNYARTRQSARLLAFVESLEAQPVLVAHSFGAAPASEAALRQPEAFGGLILVAGAIGLSSANTGSAALPLPLRSSAARGWIGSATALNPWLTGTLLRQMLHRTEAATEARIAILQRPMRLEGSTEAFADWLPSLLQPDPASISNQARTWRESTLPLALIWGREDRFTPPDQAQALAALRPGTPLYWMDAVGHIPQIEAPGEFASHLGAALADLGF